MKLALLLTLIMTGIGFAQSSGEIVDPGIVINKNIALPKAIEAIKPDRATYFSIFAGPALGGQGDPVDETGEVQENDISTWAQISFQWQLTKTTRLVINPRFSMNHNAGPDEPAIETEDHVIGINTTWYKKGDFTFGGGINTILPFMLTNGTRNDGQVINPGGFNFINYQIDSNWSVGAWLWGRARFYNRSTNAEDERFAFFGAPLVNYNFTDNYSVSLFYQVNGEIRPGWNTDYAEDDHLGIMATIDINQYITLQPQIQMFREQNFDLANSNFNMWISGRFF